MRRSFAALAVLVVTAVFAGLAPPASAAPPVTYVEPVNGRVTDPFRPPSTQYGTGNRGLEYATTDGSPARASAPGRVTFAGNVGGSLHVVVQHDDGVRTGYSFLRSIAVLTGQSVKQGEHIGTTNDSFHFGARIGDAYVDPAILLAGGPARVHLVPDGEFTEAGAAEDRNSIWAAIGDRISGGMGSASRAAVDWARGGVHAAQQAVHAAGQALASGAIDLAALAAGTASDAMRAFAAHTVTVLDAIVNMGQWAGPFAGLAAAMADIIQAFIEACTPGDQAPPPMQQPNDRVVVFIAGLGSKSASPLSDEMRPTDLGYAAGNVYDFSYRGGRNPQPYHPKDTTGDLRNRARDLRDLLDQIGRDHPGAHVDLIAHSQGGLIARDALAHDHDGPTRQLPPVDHLITLGTPHHGADAATANAWLRWTAEGRALRWLAKKMHTQFDLTGPGVAQLSETSDFIRDLNARPLRDGVAYTSIAGASDAIAPAVRARVAGATNVLVDSGNLATSHSNLYRDPGARREVKLALADAPPTCRSIADTTALAFTSVGIATFEDAVGLAARSAP